jgi:hypothetical protein
MRGVQLFLFLSKVCVTHIQRCERTLQSIL